MVVIGGLGVSLVDFYLFGKELSQFSTLLVRFSIVLLLGKY